MKIAYTAPAKVILSGEHAVVYGKHALVATINLRLKFSLWEENKDISEKNILFISKKVKKYLKDQKIVFLDKPFNFKNDSEIPIGRGLGSSAALSVAVVAAFLDFYTGRQFEKNIVNNLAYQIEKHFHKNPSGVDNSASCFGGMIFYRKKNKLLKNIIKLDFNIPKLIENKLILIDSGKPKESTAEMVSSVGKFYNKIPKTVNFIINEIEKTTKNMKISIKKEDSGLFKKCLLDNEKLLEELGVVSEKTKKFFEDLSGFGTGKITGAGGHKTDSGFILFFAEDKEKLEEYLKRKKINYYHLTQDNQGLKKV